MSFSLPIRILQGSRQPDTLIDGLPDTTTGDPSATSLPFPSAHGRISETGALGVMVDKACTLTIWYFNPVRGAWCVGGITSTDYAIAFSHSTGGLGFFTLPPGSLFYLTSDTATTKCWHDGVHV